MEHHVTLAATFAKLLDEQFGVGKFRFGLDPILGLIPGFGDALSMLLSFYIVWIGKEMHIPKKDLGEMIQNVLFDFVIGIIPIVGDIGDIAFKANTKNVAILRRHLRKNVVEGEVI